MTGSDGLRIALIAPCANPVTRHSVDSVEQLVWLLAEELTRRGHAVTLFATGDSQTSARLHAVHRRGYEHDAELTDWRFHEMMHVAAAFERAEYFDVIHSHNYGFALPFTRLVNVPVLHTFHTLPDTDFVRAFRSSPGAHVAAISRFQRSLYRGVRNVEVVYNGIDTDAFPFRSEPGDYLLFLGRLIPDKGPMQAVELARSVGMRLLMACPVDEYFEREVAPLVDGREVEYVGVVAGKERNDLLAGAAALLCPLQYQESFGLVMVEAMACGTPSVATGLGAVPEIIRAGVNGYWGNDMDQLRSLIPEALRLDRRQVRAEAVSRFDYRRMTDGYERLYRELMRVPEQQAG